MNEYQSLVMRDDITLNAKINKSENHETWVIIIHGIGEHLERHNYLPELLKGKVSTLQYDLRGHGKSTGRKAWVSHFSDYLQDLEEVINFLKDRYGMKEFILFGHSMGGLITMSYLKEYAVKSYPIRVIVNAPPAAYPGILGQIVNRLSLNIIMKLSSISKSIALPNLVDLKSLSHDVITQKEYVSDGLNQTALHTKLLLEMVQQSKKTFNHLFETKCDIFCSVGTEDKIVSVVALKDFFSNRSRKNIYYREFENGYHELHNEIEEIKKPYLEYIEKIILDKCSE